VELLLKGGVARMPRVLALVAACTLASCGGASSSDPVAVCTNVCQRYTTLCTPEAGATGMNACQGLQCSTLDQVTCRYSNMDEITAAVNACLARSTCADLQVCLATTIPAGEGCADAGAPPGG
jgi:hypothetical protein